MGNVTATPVFSIIIPTYQRAYCLPVAIESVLRQTFADWELIVVDDGSTDETRTVVARYCEADARVRYVWQENKELNGARNTGICQAKGLYLAFLDDDDDFLETHLEVVNNHIKKADAPAMVLKTGMFLEVKGNLERGKLYDSNIQRYIYQYWFYPQNLLSFVFHKSIFEKIQFDVSLLLADDFQFLVRVLLEFPFTQLESYTVVYRLQPTSRSLVYFSESQVDNKMMAIRSTWQANEKLLKLYLPKAACDSLLTREWLHFSRLAFRKGDIRLGRRYFGSALYPFDLQYFTIYLRTLAAGISATLLAVVKLFKKGGF